MSNRVLLAPGYYPDPDTGRPLALADIYVGEPDTDPTVALNQKQISVLQEDTTTVQVAQPLTTNAGGGPEYNGSPVTILVEGNYSLAVISKQGVQKYYIPSQIGLETFGQEVNDMFGLVSITGQLAEDTATMIGYFVTYPQAVLIGGGQFVWQTGIDKATANGGTIIDPSTLGGFDGTVSTRDAFLAAQGTGIGLGCWVRITDEVNVEDFGSVRSPTVDSSGSFQAALNTILAGGELEIPKATYKLTALISATVTAAIVVNGNSSTLICDAGGIKIIQSTARESVEVRDLKLHANGALLGTALDLEFTSLVSQTERTAKVVNVDVATPTAQIATSAFTYGIKLTNAWNYVIDRCNVRGSGNDTVNMAAAYWLEGQCTDGTFISSHGYFATYGFYAPLTSESEGTKIIGSYFIYVDYGVYMTPTLKQPSFFISDIHISSLIQCLHIERMDQMNWNNMLLYNRSEAVGTWTAVSLDSCSNNNINNVVTGGTIVGGLTKVGFDLTSSNNNNIKNINLTEIDGKFVETTCSANIYSGIADITINNDTARPYLESDGIGKSYFKSRQTIGTFLKTSVPIAVADTVPLADVVWDGATDHSNTGITFQGAGFTELVLPDGVDRFVVTAYIKWAASAVGNRQVTLYENGVAIQSVSVVATNEAECLIVTKPRNAAIGSTYKVAARQTSGAPLNIDTQSYLDITAT